MRDRKTGERTGKEILIIFHSIIFLKISSIFILRYFFYLLFLKDHFLIKINSFCLCSAIAARNRLILHEVDKNDRH